MRRRKSNEGGLSRDQTSLYAKIGHLLSGARQWRLRLKRSRMIRRIRLSSGRLLACKSMNEFFPLEKAAEAYERMMSGKARFRVVLEVGAES